jgi:DNA-binding NarL/FixJ family response regulator
MSIKANDELVVLVFGRQTVFNKGIASISIGNIQGRGLITNDIGYLKTHLLSLINVIVMPIETQDDLLTIVALRDVAPNTGLLGIVTGDCTLEFMCNIVKSGLNSLARLSPLDQIEKLAEPIRLTATYGMYLDTPLVLETLRKDHSADSAYTLTTRQKQIVKRILDGASNREIGVALSLSKETIKKHVSQLLRKFGVKHRSEIASKLPHEVLQSITGITP